ncbi:MAG: hypothetical protein AAF726_09575 [Planctomycetota bacterium]
MKTGSPKSLLALVAVAAVLVGWIAVALRGANRMETEVVQEERVHELDVLADAPVVSTESDREPASRLERAESTASDPGEPHVLVLDEHGRPIPDFPVVASRARQRPEVGTSDLWQGERTTDVDGRLFLGDELATRRVGAVESEHLWVGRGDGFSEESWTRVSGTTTELVVPDTARVEVALLDGNRRPWVGRARFCIAAEIDLPSSRRGAVYRRFESTGGSVYVARGTPYTVKVDSLREWRSFQRSFEPIGFDESQRRHVLTVVDRRCILVGRLIDGDGEPRRELRFKTRPSGSATTDGAGYFRLPIAGDLAELGGSTLELYTDFARGMHAEPARIALPPVLSNGDVHVGDVVAPIVPIFASGSLVLPDGRPLEFRNLQFLRRSESGAWEPTGRRVMTSTDGRFSFLGRVEGDELALDVEELPSSYGGVFALEGVVPFTPGDEDLELLTVPASSLSATIDWPLEGRPPSLRLTIDYDDGRSEEHLISSGKLHIRAVRPGHADIAVATKRSTRVLAEVRGVTLPSGAEADLGVVKLDALLCREALSEERKR